MIAHDVCTTLYDKLRLWGIDADVELETIGEQSGNIIITLKDRIPRVFPFRDNNVTLIISAVDLLCMRWGDTPKDNAADSTHGKRSDE